MHIYWLLPMPGSRETRLVLQKDIITGNYEAMNFLMKVQRLNFQNSEITPASLR